MSGPKKRPGLSSRPPAPKDLEEFLEGAGTGRPAAPLQPYQEKLLEGAAEAEADAAAGIKRIPHPRGQGTLVIDTQARRSGKTVAAEEDAGKRDTGATIWIDEAKSIQGALLTWENAGEGTERFLLRMGKRHHAMLAWLANITPRSSMNGIALDLLEPALEAAVERVRRELGV